jgi:hypothetical protein
MSVSRVSFDDTSSWCYWALFLLYTEWIISMTYQLFIYLDPTYFLIAWNQSPASRLSRGAKNVHSRLAVGLTCKLFCRSPNLPQLSLGTCTHQSSTRVQKSSRTRCERQSIFSALATSLSKRRTPRSADSDADCFIVQHQRQTPAPIFRHRHPSEQSA